MVSNVFLKTKSFVLCVTNSQCNGARSKTQRLKETFKVLCLMEPRLAADVTVNDFKSFEGALNKVM